MSMGRAPCCEKEGVKKGPWTPEEDQKLLAYIHEHGHGSWRALPTKAGLQRCGKSCRLRWTNYLRPDIKRGKFSPEEEQAIIQLHALLGNRWSAIATHLPKRTDNEIKNYWNTHLKKRLTKRGIDPATHKPINATLTSSTGGQSNKTESKLSHMAQWESARLEAEARLVRESKLRSSIHLRHQLGSTTAQSHSSCSLSLFNKAWQGHVWSKSIKGGPVDQDHVSPTSTLSFSGISPLQIPTVGCCKQEIIDHPREDLGSTTPLTTRSLHVEGNDQMVFPVPLDHDHQLKPWTTSESSETANEQIPYMNLIDGFTDDLIIDNDDSGGNIDNHSNSSNDISVHRESNNINDDQSSGEVGSYDQESKTYWNNILNLVNCSSSPSDTPMF